MSERSIENAGNRSADIHNLLGPDFTEDGKTRDAGASGRYKRRRPQFKPEDYEFQGGPRDAMYDESGQRVVKGVSGVRGKSKQVHEMGQFVPTGTGDNSNETEG